MPKEIYLFTTIKEGSRNRLRPMPFQKDKAGKAIFTRLNVQGSTEMRETYPIGTVFASETIEIRTGGETPFYAAGDIFPVSVRRADLADPRHEPSPEMTAAYNTYMAVNGDKLGKDNGVSDGASGEGTAKGRPLSLLEKLRSNPRYEKPSVENDGFYVEDDIWWGLVTNLIDNENTLFKGPTGSGKTQIVRKACEKIGIPCCVYDMGSMYDPLSEMLGVHRISSDGRSVFDYARFTRDIQTECVILLDELSRATPGVNNILMPCLDDRRTLPCEMAGGSDARSIPVHPKCRFVATANIGGEYNGTHPLDPALKDRFDIIEMRYMPPDVEIGLLTRRFRIPKADAVNIVNVATTVRNLVDKGDLQDTLSTRETLRAARRVAQGWTARQAMELAFLERYEGTRSDGPKAIVWQTILSR